MPHRIVIVGGGFAGVTAALHLAKEKLPDTEITLVNPLPYLEYYGILYRLLSGHSPAEGCMPLRLMLKGTGVNIACDRIRGIDPVKHIASGVAAYPYDTLILAPGSDSAYFNIPGMEEHSFAMKGIQRTLDIRDHIGRCIEAMKTAKPAEKARLGHIAIIGGGPSGVEAAGELAAFLPGLAKRHGVDPALIQIDLIEAMDRLLQMTEPPVSEKVLKRLQSLGVNVRLQTAVASADEGVVTLRSGETINTGTIIWTAGVKASALIAAIPGMELDKRGRVVVEGLRSKTYPDIFVLGDCASTPYTGMAQTAVYDGEFAARAITAARHNRKIPAYKPSAPAYAIPAGPNWAAVKFGPVTTCGFIGHLMRRAADVHVYMLLLPWYHVPAAFFGRLPLARNDIRFP